MTTEEKIILFLNGSDTRSMICYDAVTLEFCSYEEAIRAMDNLWKSQIVYTVNGYGTDAQNQDFKLNREAAIRYLLTS